MKPLLRLLLPWLAALWLGTAPAQTADRIEVIPLQYRTADELVPLLRPLLAGRGAVTGEGYELVVRATPERIQQVLDAVIQLDTARARLLVSVRQAGLDEFENRGGGLRGGTAVISPDGVAASGRLERRHYGTRRNDDVTQTVQVIDGGEAFIAVGQEVPVVDAVSPNYVGGFVAQLAYRNVSTGFAVRPRVNGVEVVVEITPERRTESAQGGGRFDRSAASTTLSGRLGEWLVIGGSYQTRSTDRSAVGHSTRDRASQERVLLIKVEELR